MLLGNIFGRVIVSIVLQNPTVYDDFGAPQQMFAKTNFLSDGNKFIVIDSKKTFKCLA